MATRGRGTGDRRPKVGGGRTDAPAAPPPPTADPSEAATVELELADDTAPRAEDTPAGAPEAATAPGATTGTPGDAADRTGEIPATVEDTPEVTEEAARTADAGGTGVDGTGVDGTAADVADTAEPATDTPASAADTAEADTPDVTAGTAEGTADTSEGAAGGAQAAPDTEDGSATAAVSEEERWAAFAPEPEREPGRLRRTAAAIGRVLAHEWTVAVVGSLILAVVMTWPALQYPRHTLPKDLGDPTLVSWLLAWPGHILLTDPTSLWHTNAFYPERWTYAFSDTLLGYAPAGMLGSGPADALLRYNIIFVLVHALAFIGAYALARQLGSGRIGAIVAGLAFAYAPWRLAQAEHLHVISTGGIALALAMLARGHGWSLRHGFRPGRVRPGWIMAGWLVAAWQVTLGFAIGLPFVYVMALIAVVVGLGWLVRRILRRPRHRTGPVLAADLVGGTIFAAVTVLMALPYLIVLDQHPEARRSFAEVELFSPPPQGFFIASPDNWLWGDRHAGAREALSAPSEMALLPGYALIAVAAAGLVVSVWSWRARLALALGVAASAVLALGTGFFDGVLYRPLFDWLPGWDALRTPGRLVIWTTLLLAVLAAGALTALAVRAREFAVERGYPAPGLWPRVALVVPLLLVFVEGIGPLEHPVAPPQPEALATVDGPVLVLPSDSLTDMHVMRWTTDRFVPIVNGASGYTPDTLRQVREVTTTFPDSGSVSYLRALGVETVVVLADRVEGTEWETALFATGDGLGIRREEIGRSVVFDLNP
ncbi:MAG TPA: hypothetical protein VKY81_12375 [Natronosporangium sp.]|nr:hypothetical protein [Natronosporangium sp.]